MVVTRRIFETISIPGRLCLKFRVVHEIHGSYYLHNVFGVAAVFKFVVEDIIGTTSLRCRGIRVHQVECKRLLVYSTIVPGCVSVDSPAFASDGLGAPIDGPVLEGCLGCAVLFCPRDLLLDLSGKTVERRLDLLLISGYASSRIRLQ
jgi:hypothetical protein